MFTHLIVGWVLSAALLLLMARLLPGFEMNGIGTALVAVIVIGLLNATLGFVLRLLMFPLTLLTLGLFALVINAVVLKVAAALMPGFNIRGCLPAIVAALVLSLLHLLIGDVAPHTVHL